MGEWMYRSALVEGEWSASRPDRFIPSTVPIEQEVVWAPEPVWTTWRRKFLILPGLELQPLGRPARIQSLYRLSYPGSYKYSKYPIVLQSITERPNLCIKQLLSPKTK
jgi:hypothetical protein